MPSSAELPQIAGDNWTTGGLAAQHAQQPVAQEMDGAANSLITAICKVDGGQPASVCTQSLRRRHARIHSCLRPSAASRIWRSSPRSVKRADGQADKVFMPGRDGDPRCHLPRVRRDNRLLRTREQRSATSTTSSAARRSSTAVTPSSSECSRCGSTALSGSR